MNEFVALLLAVMAFCLAFAAIGLAGRLGFVPHDLAGGSFLQAALAATAGYGAWRRALATAMG